MWVYMEDKVEFMIKTSQSEKERNFCGRHVRPFTLTSDDAAEVFIIMIIIIITYYYYLYFFFIKFHFHVQKLIII